MKKILFLVIACSFSFSGTFYIEMGQAPQYTVTANILGEEIKVTEELDKGGLTVGYHHGFFQKGKWSISAGGSYTLNPITGIRQPEDLRFSPTNSEAGFISAYLLPVYQIGEKFFAWASIGKTKGLYDLDVDEFESGNTIGYGIHIKCNDTFGIGVGFTTNTLTYIETVVDEDDVKADFDFNRTSIFFTTKIN